jgi:hypothetical protein
MSKEYPMPDSAAANPTDKAAESVAAYISSMQPKLRASVRTIAGIPADDEVWTFVKANELLPDLEAAIQLAQQAFPAMREIKLSYEPDPEIPFFNSVVIHVKASGTVEELFEQDKNYIRMFTQAVPFEHSHQIVLMLSVA